MNMWLCTKILAHVEEKEEVKVRLLICWHVSQVERISSIVPVESGGEIEERKE